MAPSDGESRKKRLETYSLSPDQIDSEDVVVKSGENVSTVDLPAQTVEPSTVEELRNMIGVTGKDTLPMKPDHIPESLPAPTGLGNAIEERNPPKGSPDENTRKAFSSLLYRGGGGNPGSGLLKEWEKVLDDSINAGYITPKFELATAKDITIHNGATLTVAKRTAVLFADVITIRGSGQIECEGDTKIDVRKSVGEP